MQYLLAHDLGTSGDKASLFTVDGTLVKSVVASYPCSYGSGNCVEQNPEAWYAAVCRTTQSLASLVDPARIAGVSFSGHMMGAVLLDGSGALLAFRDSFGNALHADLAEAFQTAVFSRAMPYDLSLMQDARPNAVLVELVDFLLREEIVLKNVHDFIVGRAPDNQRRAR